MSLGELIRRQRMRFGWTQAELAERLQVDRAYISQIETGARKWPRELIPGLAHVLQLSQVEMAVAAGLIDPPDTVPPPADDPVLTDLIARLRRLPLTGDRPATLHGVLDVWADLDRRAREHVKQDERGGDAGRLRG